MLCGIAICALCMNDGLPADENWMHNWTGLDLVRREWRRTHHCVNEIQPQSEHTHTRSRTLAAYGILINIHISSFGSNTIPIFQRIDHWNSIFIIHRRPASISRENAETMPRQCPKQIDFSASANFAVNRLPNETCSSTFSIEHIYHGFFSFSLIEQQFRGTVGSSRHSMPKLMEKKPQCAMRMNQFFE